MASLRCESCGYDRAGLPAGAVCPECGAAPVIQRKSEPLSPGASRAAISLGLGTLSWLGLVGFGIVAVPMGVGAVAVAISAMHAINREDHSDWRPLVTALGGLALGITGTLVGIVLSIVILLAL